MVTPAATNLLRLPPAAISAFAAITALAVSMWVAYEQRQLTRRQIKQSLYEKRYAVFLSAEEFLMYVLRVDGSIKLPSEEFRKFSYAAEQAQFLFGSDVVGYMNGLKKTALDLYPKTVERDHLARMNQQKPELNIDIINVLMEIGGPFLEGRAKVFGPYLQLSLSELIEGSATAMKLNGWQRLWVLVTILWLLPVALFTYSDWPLAIGISKSDVYSRMQPEDGHRLTDYYDVMASRQGWTNVVELGITKLQQDKGFMAASIQDQKAYLAHIDADFAKASPLDQNAYLGHITGITGPTVDIDGHTVQFIQNVPQEDMNQTARGYDSVLRQILRRKRGVLFGQAVAFWLVPVISLYALGIAFRWVRRGFATAT
jgi:hypothetical protein